MQPIMKHIELEIIFLRFCTYIFEGLQEFIRDKLPTNLMSFSESGMEAIAPLALLGTSTFYSGGDSIQEGPLPRRTRPSREHRFRGVSCSVAPPAQRTPPPWPPRSVDAEVWHAGPGQDDAVVRDPQHSVLSASGTGPPLALRIRDPVDFHGQSTAGKKRARAVP